VRTKADEMASLISRTAQKRKIRKNNGKMTFYHTVLGLLTAQTTVSVSVVWLCAPGTR